MSTVIYQPFRIASPCVSSLCDATPRHAALLAAPRRIARTASRKARGRIHCHAPQFTAALCSAPQRPVSLERAESEFRVTSTPLGVMHLVSPLLCATQHNTPHLRRTESFGAGFSRFAAQFNISRCRASQLHSTSHRRLATADGGFPHRRCTPRRVSLLRGARLCFTAHLCSTPHPSPDRQDRRGIPVLRDASTLVIAQGKTTHRYTSPRHTTPRDDLNGLGAGFLCGSSPRFMARRAASHLNSPFPFSGDCFLATAIATLKSVSPYSQSRHYTVPKLDKESPLEYCKRTWREHCHADRKGNILIPPMAFKNALAEAAKYLSITVKGKGKATYTKHFEAGVLVVDALVLPIKKDDVEGEWLFLPSDGKRGSGSRVDKCYPIIREWSGDVTFHVLDNTITQEVFREVLEQCGKFIGIGRFRPRNNGYYGRFTVEDIEWKKD